MKEPKQVIVFRKDLNVRKGKFASQVAHASLKVFFDWGNWNDSEDRDFYRIDGMTNEMKDWIDGLFTKIVVSCDSEQELDELYKQAKEKGLPCSMIIDAGLTEFNGVPTKTCIAIGPANPDNIDEITKHLKLL